MSEDTIVFNGIDGTTGAYLLPSMPTAKIAAYALGHPLAAADLEGMRIRAAQASPFPLMPGANPNDLAQSGWAIVFP